jgi:hypothetical protein
MGYIPVLFLLGVTWEHIFIVLPMYKLKCTAPSSPVILASFWILPRHFKLTSRCDETSDLPTSFDIVFGSALPRVII